jgi:hypothetical protein
MHSLTDTSVNHPAIFRFGTLGGSPETTSMIDVEDQNRSVFSLKVYKAYLWSDHNDSERDLEATPPNPSIQVIQPEDSEPEQPAVRHIPYDSDDCLGHLCLSRWHSGRRRRGLASNCAMRGFGGASTTISTSSDRTRGHGRS